MSFKSKIPKKSDMWIQMILFLTLVTTDKGNVISPAFIGHNCTFPERFPPQNGHSFELIACPSEVNYEPHHFCLIPDAVRCHNVCPGRCSTLQSSLKWCTIQWTCIWREVEDNTNENTTTTLAPPNESNTGMSPWTWIAIISTISLVVFALIALLIWFVFKKPYRPLRDGENVTYRHRECEEITFNLNRSLRSLAHSLSSPELCPTF